MERIIRREPNAYLAALYWDSEMFGRRTKTRRRNEGEGPPKDYKALLIEMFNDMPRYFNTEHKMKIAKAYKGLFLKSDLVATPKDYRKMYEALIRGDPKMRSLRALYQTIFAGYIDTAKREEVEKRGRSESAAQLSPMGRPEPGQAEQL